jgi:hypothetical protein
MVTVMADFLRSVSGSRSSRSCERLAVIRCRTVRRVPLPYNEDRKLLSIEPCSSEACFKAHAPKPGFDLCVGRVS